MGRLRNRRLWGVVMWGACLLASAIASLTCAGHQPLAGDPPAAMRVVSVPPDAAVLPARIGEEVRAGGQAAVSRVLILAAVLTLLAGLPAVMRRWPAGGTQGAQPLRARRYTIALRAPPLQFA